MSSVDLARVGACVLKHAVTGEVRPDVCRAVGVPRYPPRSPGSGIGRCRRGRGGVMGRSWGSGAVRASSGRWARARGGVRPGQRRALNTAGAGLGARTARRSGSAPAAPLTRPRAGRGAAEPVAGAGVRGGWSAAFRLHGVSLDRPGPQQPQGTLGPARCAPGGRGARGPGLAGVSGRGLLRRRCLQTRACSLCLPPPQSRPLSPSPFLTRSGPLGSLLAQPLLSPGAPCSCFSSPAPPTVDLIYTPLP